LKQPKPRISQNALRRAFPDSRGPNAPSSNGPWSGSHSALWIYLLLLAAVFTTYWRVFHFDFVSFDDPVYVTGNLHIRTGLTLRNMSWAFIKGYAANWIPLASISQMLDCQLFGLQSGWHHLTSLFFHALSTLLLFGLMQRMTGSLWKSLFVAFIFGLHPLRVESVAWISERKDVLGAFFWIVTLWSYIHYVQRPSRLRYLLVALSLSLGLLSKPTTVTLPFALLLLDIWPLKRIVLTGTNAPQFFRLVREKVPLATLSAAACVITYVVARRDGTIQSVELIPLGVRFSNAFVSYATYLVQLIYPAKLAVFYPYPPPQFLPTVAAVGVILLISFLVLRPPRRPYLLMGWFWYLGTLAPVLGLVQAGGQSHADRYTYIPLIGISIMLAWGLEEFAKTLPGGPTVLAGIAIAACAAWLALTWQQVGYWQNSETLFRHALDVTTGNYVAHNNYGLALKNRGRVDDAISEFRMALQDRPQLIEAHTNLGDALLAKGQTQEAAAELQESMRLNPTYPEAHIDMGTLLESQGRMQEAETQYRQAVDLAPDDAAAHTGLGSALAALGQTEEGLQQLRTGVELEPNGAVGRYDLGVVLAAAGRLDEAVTELSEAVRLQPDDPKARFNLGMALATAGRMHEALEEFTASVRLRPTDANAEFNLAKVLANLDRFDEAEVHLSEALRLAPNFEEARDALAALHAQRGGK
jgi:protein O-mannosyl-transferase